MISGETYALIFIVWPLCGLPMLICSHGVSVSRRGELRSLNKLLVEAQDVTYLRGSKIDSAAGGRPGLSLEKFARHSFVQIAPKKKQSREKSLYKLLGQDFNPKWMSVAAPADGAKAVTVARSHLSESELVADLARVNTTRIKDGAGGWITLNSQVSKVIEKWLLQKASCPITYVWDDLGSYFWPRWIKRGTCDRHARGAAASSSGWLGQGIRLQDFTNPKQEDDYESCSWPPGMHCVPADSRTIYILRWHCRRRSGRRRKLSDKVHKTAKTRMGASHRQGRRTRMRCSWLKVPYPVTSECFCSC